MSGFRRWWLWFVQHVFRSGSCCFPVLLSPREPYAGAVAEAGLVLALAQVAVSFEDIVHDVTVVAVDTSEQVADLANLHFECLSRPRAAFEAG